MGEARFVERRESRTQIWTAVEGTAAAVDDDVRILGESGGDFFEIGETLFG